jgi:hypothetical protein
MRALRGKPSAVQRASGATLTDLYVMSSDVSERLRHLHGDAGGGWRCVVWWS